MPFNKVPYTSDFRRYLADIFLHSQKLHLFYFGRKKHFFERRRRTTLCPTLSVRTERHGRLCFVLGLGKEKETNRIKCNRILLNYPQNLVRRAVQNVKNQVRIFVRNYMGDVK